MTFLIQAVPAVAVLNRWKDCEPLLASTMPAGLGRCLPEDILVMLLQNTAQAWFVTEGEELLAVAVSRIDQYPRARAFCLFALGGKKLRQWFDQFDETLTAAALKLGCTQVEIAGRKGWEKLLGVEPMAHVFVKNLEPGSTRTFERKAEGGAMA